LSQREIGEIRLPATLEGEQYAVAALLFRLVAGSYYRDFSLDAPAMMRQIAEEPPLSFTELRVDAWPAIEALLARALDKNPARRFASMAEFESEWRAVDPRCALVAPVVAANRPDLRLDDAVQAFIERASPGGELFAKGFEEAPRASVNLGAGGIAFALYRLSLRATTRSS
jgi:serine/threonine-protein kinase